MYWIAVATLGIAVIGTAFSFFIAHRNRQLSRPKLSFDVESQTLRKKLRRIYHHTPITNIAFGFETQKDDYALVFLPLVVENTGKVPVQNIKLQLILPAGFEVDDIEDIKQAAQGKYRFNEMATEGREIRRMCDRAVKISYEIPLLRPGEVQVIGEPIRLVNHKSHSIQSIQTIPLKKRLASIKLFSDFCVIDAKLFSDSTAPISFHLNLLWFQVHNIKMLEQCMNESLQAFWIGSYPKPGLYRNFIRFPWNHWLRGELAMLILPKMARVSLTKQHGVLLEKSMEGKQYIMRLLLPKWNYHHLSAPPFKPEWMRSELMYKIYKIADKQLKKWKIIRK